MSLKIDISTMPIPSGGFDAFVEERIAGMLAGPGAKRLGVSEPQPYELAGFSGVRYTITEEAASPEVAAPPPVEVLVLGLSDERVAVIAIVPADSTAYDQGIAVLSTLTFGPRRG